MTAPTLFTPLSLRSVTLKNRIAVSPMWQYAGERGFPVDWHLMHLGRFAAGGAGLVMQEGTAVERRGCGTLGDLGLWHDDFIGPLSRITALIRDNGAVPGIQLMHAGRKGRQLPPYDGKTSLPRARWAEADDGWELVAPSALPLGPGYDTPRAMALGDIDDVVQAFGCAAGRALRAGYEVIELHAAHGYLLHQFLSPLANCRTDHYGGTFENRSRLLLQVVAAVRAKWPEDKPLFVRLSCVDGQGWTLADTLALASTLHSAGVDVIDCSTGGINGQPSETSGPPGYGYQVPFAARLRHEAGIATAAVGYIVHAAHANDIIERGDADLVMVGREHLYNPNWALDASQKLGADRRFAQLHPRVGFFLDRRTTAFDGMRPSTFGSDDCAGTFR